MARTRVVERPESPYSHSLLAIDVWADFQITFSFPRYNQYTGYADDPATVSNHQDFTDAQKDAARTVLAQVSSYTNLTFVEVSGVDAGSATLRFGNTRTTDSAFAYLPVDLPEGGDAWFSNEPWMLNPQRGDYAYFAIIHEIGHTLGLDHPHDNIIGIPMPADRDWIAYTVMSYRSAAGGPLGYRLYENEFAQTFMQEDIAALQQAYGANFDFNSGNTVYSMDENTGELFINGVGEGAPASSKVLLTIWDGGGEDTYDFSSYIGHVYLNLEPGGWTKLPESQRFGAGYPAMPGGIANAYLFEGDQRSIIENAIGGSGNDELIGNDVANRLEGGEGRDRLYGNGGDDFLFGGAADDGVYGGAGNDYLDGGDGTDSIHGNDGDDRLIGGRGRDSMDGGPGNDYLDGGDDSDFLRGGDGADELFGRDGRDNLRGDAGNDFLDGGNDADTLDGGDGDDKLFGSLGDDELFGRDGNDELIGGLGDDRLDGGPGIDSLIGGLGNDYYVWDEQQDIITELPGEGVDTILSHFDITLSGFANIENVNLYWSARDVTGNDADNTIVGNALANIIDGGSGADLMRGLRGDDTYYVDNSGDVIYEMSNEGFDTVYASVSFALLPHVRYSYGTRSSVELLVLTGTADIDLGGSEIANELRGNSGNNRLFGGAGEDLLFGDLGDDVIHGGEDTDTAVFTGVRDEYVVEAVSLFEFRVTGPDGTDLVRGIELLEFADQTISIQPQGGIEYEWGRGGHMKFAPLKAKIEADMENIRDYDGNDLGGDLPWVWIDEFDIDGDGDIDDILVNKSIGRFAIVGGNEYDRIFFDDYGENGETRVVGIYIDPLVASGVVEQGSDFDSQRRFQNDLEIENLKQVFGADDYDGDGLQEVYFGLTDGTAYLHAYMHADGNIQYANYQSEAQVKEYLEANGYDETTYGNWFHLNSYVSASDDTSNLAYMPTTDTFA
ncbi:M10 family metallopeptidase C-terminal domain-containing protein [Aurantiacibacter poecillastricola]|uniref:M10 family metallopeptidase C-terminal domain-containing protein n=1 Tax=Aurantiacibacter poecillastricola TaxID=3064385 RepID=UPI00273DD272|nr:M10 family metallopeptidase C-terminal domain-containing protein [Aurantiacibacter sp. 219JJ12-13]MDP5261367.1 M10 family metallopeptidase C-terminal domain-containing protein [Aurantiacibacter sp. 219JJ12-13]